MLTEGHNKGITVEAGNHGGAGFLNGELMNVASSFCLAISLISDYQHLASLTADTFVSVMPLNQNIVNISIVRHLLWTEMLMLISFSWSVVRSQLTVFKTESSRLGPTCFRTCFCFHASKSADGQPEFLN